MESEEKPVSREPWAADPLGLILAATSIVLAAFIATLLRAREPGSALEVRVGTFAIVSLGLAIAAFFRLRRDRSNRGGFVLGFLLGSAFFATGAFYPNLITRSPLSGRTACLSNTKQLGLGVIMYQTDYDDRWPLQATWHDDLEPYLRSQFRCPAAQTPWNYAMNSEVFRVDVAKLANPATAPMVFEADSYSPNVTGAADWFAPRHANKGNVGFCDGHAKLVAPAAITWKP